MATVTYAAVKAVCISQDYSARSYTAADRLAFGRGASGGEYRLLLGFDPIALPVGSRLESAVLTLEKTAGAIGSNAGFTARCCRLTGAFAPGTCWDDNVPFTAEGAFSAATGAGHEGELRFTVTPLVQAWLDGAQQCGLMLQKPTSGGVYIKCMLAGSARLTLTYAPGPTAFTLDRDTADAGSTLTLTPGQTEPGYTHTARLSVAGQSYPLFQGVTAAQMGAVTLPLEAVYALPDAESAPAALQLDTCEGAELIGTYEQPFTLTVPADFVPAAAGLSAEPVGNEAAQSWGLAVQHVTGARLTALLPQGAGGSRIAAFTFAGPGFTRRQEGDSYDTAPLTQSGTAAFTLTLTDSRGRKSAPVTAEMTVLPYQPPTLGNVTAFRCDGEGTPAGEGAYVSAAAALTWASVGQNAAAADVALLVEGEQLDAAPLPGDGTPVILGGSLTQAQSAAALFTARDTLGGTASARADLPAAPRSLNITPDGSGVAVGGFAREGTFTSHLPAEFLQGIALAGRSGLVGIGTFTGDIDSLQALPVNTVAWLTPDTPATGGGYAYLCTWGAVDGLRLQLFTNYSSGTRKWRMYCNSQWTQWAWDNPPLLQDVEYLTTRRYGSHGVYAKRIAFGSLPGAAARSVAHGIPMTRAVGVWGVDSGGTVLPRGECQLSLSPTTVTATSTQNLSGRTASLVLEYTKT